MIILFLILAVALVIGIVKVTFKLLKVIFSLCLVGVLIAMLSALGVFL